MSTHIGIVVDVSASMQANAVSEVEVGGRDRRWARSVFSVINDLIKHDVSAENNVFAVAVGASCGHGIFDILSSIKNLPTDLKNRDKFLEYSQIVEEFYGIVEENGAVSIRKWAQENIIKEVVTYDMARLILKILKKDQEFVQYFVQKCLPQICRDVPKPVRFGVSAAVTMGAMVLLPPPLNMFGITGGIAAYKAQGVIADVATKTGHIAKEEDIIVVVEKAKSYLLKDVNKNSITGVHTALEIIHGRSGETELTDERIDELMEIVEPFIYGRTPLYQALTVSKGLMLDKKYSRHKKLLFVLSDGEPTDEGNLEDIISELQSAEVTVAGCYITNTNQVEPKRLYSSPNQRWDDHTKFLFKLSSAISTQRLPRTIFIKQGWKIDDDNNETKLFLHVNHPDIMKDACDLARNVVCSQDALSDLLVSVSLDMYISQSTSEFKAQTQVGGTCYANASAAVLHLAMKRILGREGGYPDFTALRQEMITLYGDKGAVTFNVLQNICPKYRLHCQEVKVVGAMHAITAKRPVVATFRLTDSEWDIFSKFFRENPTGILTKKELEIKRPTPLKVSGHAVVLTSFNSKCLSLMNSWGHTWGDMGFFRIRNASVLDLEFVDVYWTLNDLTKNERKYHAEHGKEVAASLIQKFKALQIAKYECPLCRDESFVTDFTGSLLQAQCPKCNGIFKYDETGNNLALNMYLLSLSR